MCNTTDFPTLVEATKQPKQPSTKLKMSGGRKSISRAMKDFGKQAGAHLMAQAEQEARDARRRLARGAAHVETVRARKALLAKYQAADTTSVVEVDQQVDADLAKATDHIKEMLGVRQSEEVAKAAADYIANLNLHLHDFQQQQQQQRIEDDDDFSQQESMCVYSTHSSGGESLKKTRRATTSDVPSMVTPDDVYSVKVSIFIPRADHQRFVREVGKMIALSFSGPNMSRVHPGHVTVASPGAVGSQHDDIQNELYSLTYQFKATDDEEQVKRALQLGFNFVSGVFSTALRRSEQSMEFQVWQLTDINAVHPSLRRTDGSQEAKESFTVEAGLLEKVLCT